MKLMTRGRFACAVLSWIGVLALLAMAPVAMAAPPVVEAGPDRTQPNVQPGDGELLTLDVVSVSDPDGDLLRYEWYLTSPGVSEFYVGSGSRPARPHDRRGFQNPRRRDRYCWRDGRGLLFRHGPPERSTYRKRGPRSHRQRCGASN